MCRLIVAVNKIDKPASAAGAGEAAAYGSGLMPSEWGGDTEVVEVSAKKRQNLEKLLEIILLVADWRS